MIILSLLGGLHCEGEKKEKKKGHCCYYWASYATASGGSSFHSLIELAYHVRMLKILQPMSEFGGIRNTKTLHTGKKQNNMGSAILWLLEKERDVAGETTYPGIFHK